MPIVARECAKICGGVQSSIGNGTPECPCDLWWFELSNNEIGQESAFMGGAGKKGFPPLEAGKWHERYAPAKVRYDKNREALKKGGYTGRDFENLKYRGEQGVFSDWLEAPDCPENGYEVSLEDFVSVAIQPGKLYRHMVFIVVTAKSCDSYESRCPNDAFSAFCSVEICVDARNWEYKAAERLKGEMSLSDLKVDVEVFCNQNDAELRHLEKKILKPLGKQGSKVASRNYRATPEWCKGG